MFIDLVRSQIHYSAEGLRESEREKETHTKR